MEAADPAISASNTKFSTLLYFVICPHLISPLLLLWFVIWSSTHCNTLCCRICLMSFPYSWLLHFEPLIDYCSVLILEIVFVVSYCKQHQAITFSLLPAFIHHRPCVHFRSISDGIRNPIVAFVSLVSRLVSHTILWSDENIRISVSRASFRRSGSAAIITNKAILIISQRWYFVVDCTPRYDAYSCSRGRMRREGAPSMMFCNRLKTTTPRRLYWVRPPNPEHI